MKFGIKHQSIYYYMTLFYNYRTESRKQKEKQKNTYSITDGCLRLQRLPENDPSNQ